MEKFYEISKNVGYTKLQLHFFKPKAEFMFYEPDFSSTLPTLTNEFTTIFSSSPQKNNYNLGLSPIENYGANEYLGRKRLIPLTSPLTSKIIQISPIKKPVYTPIKNNNNNSQSAFKKNLIHSFEACKQDK
jgi:hypothetical protein